ncbi:MAG: extracellular solute-binding protein [Coriobacteriia bacterium]|nr:extracellular solute-binding protein [Coriobacteriia bacterium]
MGKQRWTRLTGVLLAAATVLAVVGCAQPAAPPTPTSAVTDLVVSSTTSTQDSGLFDVLIPAFEKAYPTYKVKVIAVGTGEALKLGETKDADVMLVHAKASEEKSVADGFAIARFEVMYNDFIVVGPASDPAKVKASANTTEAMASIQKAGKAGDSEFVSRGDDSGTHKKELQLWATSGVEPTPTADADKWYLSTGQGMGETLKIASEKGAYTLTDRATYLTMRDSLDLEVIYEKDKALLNQYGVLPVTDAKNMAGAEAFAAYITSPEGQKLIGEYGLEKFGEQLFTPNATGTASF